MLSTFVGVFLFFFAFVFDLWVLATKSYINASVCAFPFVCICACLCVSYVFGCAQLADHQVSER